MAHLSTVAALDDPAALEKLEALTARFARLQDFLIRPFPAIAYLELEEDRAERMPDLLNLMEKRHRTIRRGVASHAAPAQ